ncbi:DUF5677 domain-containing protein [Providencia manganoxydans]|uniref:DUF5677 domain-containing protein n=1 Tax=Providencia manganoxydans TaxID=2923283 RepID=UPI0032DB22A6
MSVKNIESEEGMVLWRECLNTHLEHLVENLEIVRNTNNDRVVKLYPLYASIIEDAISLDILTKYSRLNQCYIISRALLERVINYCYLLYASNEEYESFVDYTKNKAARSLSRKIELDGVKKVSVDFANGYYELPEDYKRAVDKFTSKNGKEIPRWTSLNIDKRACFLDEKSGKNLLLHVLMIYGDASEALHGTLYGALFHLGTYNIDSIPTDQKSLDEHRNSTLSFLYFMASSAIGTLFFSLKDNGIGVNKSYELLELNFKNAAVNTGLAKL